MFQLNQTTKQLKKDNKSIVSYSEKQLQYEIDKAVEEATKGMLTKDKINQILKMKKLKKQQEQR